MSYNPLISVIIPIYNVEKYMDRCLESVVTQTYSNLEIILVDDGSPDKCPQKCESWKKKDARIIVVHKKNGGLSSARNAGLDICTGEYICFVDSDDWIEKDMIQHLLDLIQSEQNLQIAQCDYIISQDYELLSEQLDEKISIWTRKDMLDFFFRLHGEKTNTGVWNKLILKEILHDFTFVDTLNEDVEASYEFFTRAEKMIVTNQIFYHYFVNKSGITNSQFKLRDMDYLSVCERILKRTKKEQPAYSDAAEYYRKRANFTILSKMKLRGYDKKNPEHCRIYRELKKTVRKDFWYLIRGNMQRSRKLLLIYVVL